MNNITTLAIVLGTATIAVAALSLLKASSGRKGSFVPPKPKNPLTKNEQPMYYRLKETFPDHVVLAQVAFGALLQSPDRNTRNRYDRKIADFVLCDTAFRVMAVIELDDSSHKGREKQDSDRDKLLTSAGYKVLRYKHVPDVPKLTDDVKALFA